MEEIIRFLKKHNKTIATMESCTGGGIANAITNVDGASDVFCFSAVTYSNFYKIKMGVSSEVIEKYSVYSMETAMEMSKNISSFTNSNYGIGVTGKINKIDKNNLFGDDSLVFVSIYDKDNDKYYNNTIKMTKDTRFENKELIISLIINKMLEILK